VLQDFYLLALSKAGSEYPFCDFGDGVGENATKTGNLAVRGLQYIFSAKNWTSVRLFTGGVGRYPGAGANASFVVLGTGVGETSPKLKALLREDWRD
jgi:hypothetical protein